MNRNPVARTVPLLGMMAASLVAGCERPEPRGPGAISVISTATAGDLSFLQYGVAVNNGTPRQAYAGTVLSFVETGLAHGEHTVKVSGLPTQCTGGGDRTVTLLGDDTAKVQIAINCPRTTGDISIGVSTTGPDPDLTGYIVMVDGQPRAFLPATGSTQVKFLAPGSHSVALSDVAANCNGGASQSVNVVAGDASQVNFAVTCTPVATLRFQPTIVGDDRDPDGYVAKIGNQAFTVSTATATDIKIPAGTIDWALEDIQPNCSAAGATSGSTDVAAGQTVTVNLDVTCAVIPAGAVGLSATDPANDTISSTFSGSTLPHDIVAVSTRHDANWLTVVVRFSRAVSAGLAGNAQGVFGYIEFDTDESAVTGGTPASNSFGASASSGIDYAIYFFGSDSVSTEFLKRSGSTGTVVGRVRTRFSGDSLVVQVPLAKLGADDGNLAMVLLFGTQDRPNDYAPNIGSLIVRKPSSIITAMRVGESPWLVLDSDRPDSGRQLPGWRKP